MPAALCRSLTRAAGRVSPVRQVVSLLPVMRRIHVREAVLADKRQQKTIGLRLEAQATAFRKFVERDGRDESRRGDGAAPSQPPSQPPSKPMLQRVRGSALAESLTPLCARSTSVTRCGSVGPAGHLARTLPAVPASHGVARLQEPKALAAGVMRRAAAAHPTAAQRWKSASASRASSI